MKRTRKREWMQEKKKMALKKNSKKSQKGHKKPYLNATSRLSFKNALNAAAEHIKFVVHFLEQSSSLS